MKHYETPDGNCFTCGHKFDVSSGGERKPKPGDFSICINCGELGVYDDSLRIVPPTEEDLLQAPLVEIAQIQKALREAREEYESTHDDIQQEINNATHNQET